MTSGTEPGATIPTRPKPGPQLVDAAPLKFLTKMCGQGSLWPTILDSMAKPETQQGARYGMYLGVEWPGALVGARDGGKGGALAPGRVSLLNSHWTTKYKGKNLT